MHCISLSRAMSLGQLPGIERIAIGLSSSLSKFQFQFCSAAFSHPRSFMASISLAYKPAKPSSSSSFDRRIRARSPSLITILVMLGDEPTMPRTGTVAPSM